MTRALRMTVLAVFIASGIPATAHHSNPAYFDMSTAITLEGEIVRVEWINPHILLYLQSKNDKGQSETWILHGASLNSALHNVGSMKERLGANGLDFATRRRQKIFVHRRSRGDQVLQWRCCDLWLRTEVLRRQR